MKHLLVIVSVILIACSMNACRTMKGLGQDISAGGQDLTRAAEKHTN